MKSSRPKFKRVLLKISGEALAPASGHGIDMQSIGVITGQIAGVVRNGVQTAVVVGGGNIFRGNTAGTKNMERVTADYMGMLATVINALALQESLEKKGIMTRVQTAIEIERVAEPFIRRRALRHLEKNRVVIFAAGTGNPYFTTDTAAALRAVEIGADVVIKGTKVDGVYTADPVKKSNARKFDRISYMEAIDRGLKVMDATAITLCMENKLPIIVFNLMQPGNFRKVIFGEKVGTTIS